MSETVDGIELPKGFKSNSGKCPPSAFGKRVRVILRHNGAEPTYANVTRPDLPPGWAADGRNGCRWSLIGSPFDIVGFRVL